MFIAGPSSQPPLSSIAERRSNSGEDSDEEDDGATGGWKVAEARVEGTRSSLEEGVIKAGYLWKKGERRKVSLIQCNVLLLESIERVPSSLCPR